MQRNADGKVVFDPKQVGAIIAIVSAAWGAGVWLANTDRVVNDDFPAHVVASETSQQRISRAIEEITATQQSLAELQEREQDAALREQIEYEIKCEKPRSDLPRDFCDDIIAAKRMREAGGR